MPIGEHTFGDTAARWIITGLHQYRPHCGRPAFSPLPPVPQIHCIFGPDVAGRTSRRTKLAAPGSLQPLPLS